MISRRALGVSAVASGLAWQSRAQAGPAGVPPSGRIAFEAFRAGSRIGSHVLEFSQTGDALTVRLDIRFAVGLGPITLYRYTMQGLEQWVGGRFTALETETNDDGTPHRVSVSRNGGGLLVRSSGAPDRHLSANTLPLTHWAIAAMSAPLFNPQDGKPMDCRVTPAGATAVTLPGGRVVGAQEYAMTGEVSLQDWYDAQQMWVMLQAKGKDGVEIIYRMV